MTPKKIMIAEDILDIKGDRIIFKKGKTIIKDFEYLENLNFIKSLDMCSIKYKFLLEEWEIWNEKKIQLICANDGKPLRPVHTVVNINPPNGAKALFQSEKMLILKMSNGMYEFTKNIINEKGQITINVLKLGKYSTFEDVKKEINELYPVHEISGAETPYQNMLDSLIQNDEKYKNEGYLEPFYCGS